MFPRIRWFSYRPEVQQYAFLWLKYVEGVDLGQHCQKCLLGITSRRIGTRHILRGVREFKDVPINEASAPAFYLCGVTEPYCWKDNFHLAFQYDKGGVVAGAWNSLEYELQDARKIEISNGDLDSTFEPKTCSVNHYMTCRNLHFAWSFAAGKFCHVKQNRSGNGLVFLATGDSRQKDLF